MATNASARIRTHSRDPSRIGLRFPVEVGLCGNARSTLQLLIPHIRRRADRSRLSLPPMRDWSVSRSIHRAAMATACLSSTSPRWSRC